MALVNILTGIGLTFLLLGVLLQNIGNDSLPGSFVALGFFFGGLSGLPIIFREEVNYTIFKLEGFLAVLVGIVIVLAGLTVSVLIGIGIVNSFLIQQ